ncbi:MULTISPECIES: DUF5343 domain-containing protein [unclassified Bradyrhizobium]|uniref:DUF5343 domain-containing protein n=1 Tax=unclassified Bradyrhizobium TaxID=2631580 RepID=UPI0028E69482|nr:MULTISPECIES: DUF5343 domain-containing protein [unclassified Bradyrhizobium]
MRLILKSRLLRLCEEEIKLASYPYTLVTGKLKDLLHKARTTGTPAKLTAAHLKTLGFTSSNDVGMIGVFKFIGLVDQSGIPTPLWTEFRGKDHRKVLAKAIRQGYAELFTVYPDAHARSVSDLTHVFSTSTTGGEAVVKQTVQTFKSLIEEADFNSSPDASTTALSAGTLHLPAAPSGAPNLSTSALGQGAPEVHIDIQIHISPESSAEQIEKIFESMAKHLYGKRADGRT